MCEQGGGGRTIVCDFAVVSPSHLHPCFIWWKRRGGGEGAPREAALQLLASVVKWLEPWRLPGLAEVGLLAGVCLRRTAGESCSNLSLGTFGHWLNQQPYLVLALSGLALSPLQLAQVPSGACDVALQLSFGMPLDDIIQAGGEGCWWTCYDGEKPPDQRVLWGHGSGAQRGRMG